MSEHEPGFKCEHCPEEYCSIPNRRQSDAMIQKMDESISELKDELKELTRSLRPIFNFTTQAKIIGVVATLIFGSSFLFTVIVKKDLQTQMDSSKKSLQAQMDSCKKSCEEKIADLRKDHDNELLTLRREFDKYHRQLGTVEQRASQIETKYLILDERLLHVIKSIEDNTSVIADLVEKIQ